MRIWPQTLPSLLSSHSQWEIKVLMANSGLWPVRTLLSPRYKLGAGGKGGQKDDRRLQERGGI